MTKQLDQLKGNAGRKELLTRELARKIAKLIERLPDSGIDVTWENVIDQVNQRYGHAFHRNVLSQKAWDGRKLIAEAFRDAKEVQRRVLRDKAPKYLDSSRSKLRSIIAKLQAENLALRERLDQVRAQQYDEVYSLLDLRTPLHRIVDVVAARNSGPQVIPLAASNQ